MSCLFNGTDAVFSVPGTANVLSGNAGPWTIVLWFKPTNLTQSSKYLLREYGTGQNVLLWEFTNDQITYYGLGYTGTNPATDSGITIPDTNWHHIAYRKAASGTSAYDKFLDGAKSSINASVAFTLGSTTTSMYLASTAAGSFTACRLADVAGYRSALSDEQIAGLAGGNTALWCPGMAYYFPFKADLAEKIVPLSVTTNATLDADHPSISDPPSFYASFADGLNQYVGLGV
jgi:hypothetical protein